VIIVEQFGQVMELKSDNKALVKVRQHLSCGKCGRCAGFFGDPETRDHILVEVNNPIGAKEGELVRLEAKAHEMLLAAFLLYFVPLIGLLAGVFLGRNWAIARGLAGNPDLWGLITGLVLMVVFFLFLRAQEGNFKRGNHFKAIITSVVSEEEIPADSVE
jgi:sigma-E factor negative regulatory protein RseC